MKKLCLILAAVSLSLFFSAAAGMRCGKSAASSKESEKTFNVSFSENGKAEVNLAETGLSESRPQNEMAESENLYPVTVIVDPSVTGIDEASSIDLMGSDGGIWGDVAKKQKTFEVPEGDYLLQVSFISPNYAAVFIPDIHVDGPVELHVCRDQADVKMTAVPLLPDGKKIVLPGKNHDEDSDEDFNTISSSGRIKISYDGQTKCTCSFIAEFSSQEYEDMMSVYTNVKDSHVRFLWTFNLETVDGKSSFFHITATADQGLEFDSISNDVSLYRPLDIDIVNSPASTVNGLNGEGSILRYSVYYSDNSEAVQFESYSNVQREIWVCNDMSEKNGTYSLVRMSTVDEFIRNTPYGVMSAPASYDNGVLFFYSTPETGMYANPEFPGNPNSFKYPVNPKFSFEDFDALKFGNSVPICVVTAETIDWEEPPFSYPSSSVFIGNEGEDRVIDNWLATVDVKENDDVLIKNASINDFISWCMERGENNGSSVNLTYVFHDYNVEIDGLPGSNTCEMEISKIGQGISIPTVQRLSFIDRKGQPAVRFKSADDGIIRLTGGAFTRHGYSVESEYGPISGDYITYSDVDLTVEYAPYGSESFKELDMTEISDRSVMPGYGAYWEGCMDQINTKSENGWFDLRITLRDGCGNIQRQILSPCFYIDNLAGIQNISDGSGLFNIVNDRIYAANGELAEVYNLQGVKIENVNLGSGLYIALYNGVSRKIVIKK